MSKSYRIRTTPGEDNGYLKVNVDLNQDYDHLEILSLKISQIDEYQNYCSDYGVIAGRVDVNNGFGVPNVKVSIFVPVEEIDLDDPVISKLYPYEDPFPDKKNINGIRYNILPKNKQTLDHTPVGTFPRKREILDDATTLEMYEKYYKFTTTTNKSGDYILFGVPLGEHYLHYDCDISDIGFISVRPYEMMREGYSEQLFRNRFKFKKGNNLEKLPQIFSQNIPITVEPFWCDSLSVGSRLGINRLDFPINYEITPTAIFTGSIFSDDEKDSLNKNCKPGRQMGKMNEVITGSGGIEAIRRNKDGDIQPFFFEDDTIDENGNWSVLVPMNIRKVITDEFGNLVPSPDGIAGIATEGDYRFRMSMDATGTDKRLRQRAKFLVPNINNNFNFGEYSTEDVRNSEDFTINRQLSTITDETIYSADTANQYNYLEEFYPFRWKKVYTVKQYIGRMQKANGNDEARGFIGIKDIMNSEGVNKFPSNRFDTNIHPIYAIICILLSLVGIVIGFINGIIMMLNGLITEICQFRIPTKIILLFCIDLGAFGKGICSASYKAKCTGTCGETFTHCGNCKCYPCNKKKAALTLEFGWKCIFGKVICQNCNDICVANIKRCCCGSTQWSSPTGDCSNVKNREVSLGPPTSPNDRCCYTCCIKIPLIPLKCAEEGFDSSVALLATPFGTTDCNRRYAKPFGCKNCGGFQTQVVKDWVSCLMEPVAVFLKMLKFDFYNDWVGGSLYFPLIKRKYKLKKRKRKFGQIKKDKFCDFECRDGQTDDFQGDLYYSGWRIKLKDIIGTNPSITVGGCTAKVKGKRVTNWYGTEENDDETYNLNLAVKEMTFKGTNSNSDGCVIEFATWSIFQSTFNAAGLSSKYKKESKEISTEHGKPEYIETEDAAGNSTWKNIGGHGHYKNTCDNTNMVERKEFFKTSLDCLAPVDETYSIPGEELVGKLGNLINYYNLPCKNTATDWQDCLANEVGVTLGGGSVNQTGTPRVGFCIADCDPDCGSNGVAPCRQTNLTPISNYNGYEIRHGLITWYDEKIYYTPRILEDDSKFNRNEYKGNLLLPTTIMELGSSVYCDIDDAPFIMDQLEPTTFAVSMEDMRYKFDQGVQYNNGLDDTSGTADDENGVIREITKYEDKKDTSLNLRAYVEFSCISVVCANTSAAVNQSQLGVEIIDKNDIGIEIGNCFVRFEHDTDLREYFCKRFNGYQRKSNDDLNFHHARPGSIQFDNEYGAYPDITLTDGFNLYYRTLEGNVVKSEYNDADPFTPGDGCGYKPDDNANPLYQKTDYFYGLAPGQTSGFINYPNYDTVDSASGTINFGVGAQSDGTGADGTDEIFQGSGKGDDYEDDDNNGSESVKGVRHNRSQTPYFQFFGIVPGKTALNKVVGRFFADKIDAVTLLGAGASPDDVSQSSVNKPNVNNEEDNPFTVFRTCLGDTLIEKVKVGDDAISPVAVGGVPGCTNPSATNWNPLATVDDGNCTFSSPPVGENTLNGVINSSDSVTCSIQGQPQTTNRNGQIVINDTTSPIQIESLPGGGSTGSYVVAKWGLQLINSNGSPIFEGTDYTYVNTGSPTTLVGTYSPVYINAQNGIYNNNIFRYASDPNIYGVDIYINTPGEYTYVIFIQCIDPILGATSDYNSTTTISV